MIMAEIDLVQQIAQLNMEICQHLDQELAPYGVNSSNYFYVMKIQVHPGIVQSEFTALVNVNPSTITRAVNHLVKLGLVVKKAHPKDRRATQLYLTDLGAAKAAGITQVVDGFNNYLIGLDDHAYAAIATLRQAVAKRS